MAGNKQDVLVKLSAEGEEQVVAAFAKMAEAAKKSGKDTEDALKKAGETAKELGATLVGLFAAEKGIAGLKDLVVGAFEAAEGLEKLHKTTGLSTDSLQAYSFAAKRAGVDQQELGQAIGAMERSIYRAEQGSRKQVDALAALGIKAKDLVGLSPDEAFNKIAIAIGSMHDKTAQAAVSMALMGGEGLKMIGVFRRIADEGMDAYIAKLKEMGVYMDEATVKQMGAMAKAVKDQAATMKAEVQGMATQFAIGLVPAVQNAMDTILKATTGPGVSGFKTLGQWVGFVVDLIAKGMKLIGTSIGETLGNMSVQVEKQFSIMTDKSKTWVERLKAAATLTSPIALLSGGDTSGTKAAASDFWATLTAGPEQFKLPEVKSDEAGTIGGANANSEKALADEQKRAEARLKLKEQLFANERAAQKAHLDELQADIKKAYDEGLISLREYFDARKAIQQQQNESELRELQARRAAIAASPLNEQDPAAEIKRKTELAKIDGEIAAKQIENAAKLAQLDAEEATAQRTNDAAALKAKEALFSIEGKRIEQQRLALELRLQELDQTLRRGGVSDAERGAALGTGRTQGEAQIAYQQTAEDLKAKLKDLQDSIAAIKQEVADGKLFPIQAEQQIIELEKQRIPGLQETAQKLNQLATATGNATNVEQAKQATLQVNGYAVAVNQAGQEMAKLKQVGQDAFVNGLSNALTGVINGTKKAGDAFRQFGYQLATALEQAIVKMLIMKALQAAMGFAGGGPVGGSGGGGGAAPGLATGGLVSGPGTNTSDSIPAMLSNGEFVVHAKAVAQPGVRALLDAINGGGMRALAGAGGVPHYASGGFVSGGGAAQTNFKVVNVLDPSTLGDHLATAQGEQAVLNIMSRNPNRIREALG